MLSGLLLVGDVETVIPICSCLIWVLFKFCEKEQPEMAITGQCTNWSHSVSDPFWHACDWIAAVSVSVGWASCRTWVFIRLPIECGELFLHVQFDQCKRLNLTHVRDYEESRKTRLTNFSLLITFTLCSLLAFCRRWYAIGHLWKRRYWNNYWVEILVRLVMYYLPLSCCLCTVKPV